LKVHPWKKRGTKGMQRWVHWCKANHARIRMDACKFLPSTCKLCCSSSEETGFSWCRRFILFLSICIAELPLHCFLHTMCLTCCTWQHPMAICITFPHTHCTLQSSKQVRSVAHWQGHTTGRGYLTAAESSWEQESKQPTNPPINQTETSGHPFADW